LVHFVFQEELGCEVFIFAFELFCRDNFGVIVYPEGHRYKGEGTLSLKTGVMEVAYNLHTPCQIVMSNGKEKLMDEVNLTINKNSLVTIFVSEVMDPTKFATKEEWFEFVNAKWKEAYEYLESTESDGHEFFGPLPGIDPESFQSESVPPKRRFVSLSVAVAVLVVLITALCL